MVKLLEFGSWIQDTGLEETLWQLVNMLHKKRMVSFLLYVFRQCYKQKMSYTYDLTNKILVY